MKGFKGHSEMDIPSIVCLNIYPIQRFFLNKEYAKLMIKFIKLPLMNYYQIFVNKKIWVD